MQDVSRDGQGHRTVSQLWRQRQRADMHQVQRPRAFQMHFVRGRRKNPLPEMRGRRQD